MTSVKATFPVKTDVEGRRPGSRRGLETLLVQAENYECYRLDISGVLMKVYAFHLKSNAATQKLKSLGRF